MDVIGLLKAVEDAYVDVQTTRDAREAAAQVHAAATAAAKQVYESTVADANATNDAAVTAHSAAMDRLRPLQEQLNAILGNAANNRFRTG